MSAADWLRFEYRDFYDVPRLILVEWRGQPYLLDCPFDEEADEYSEFFNVYRLSAAAAARLRGKASWEEASRLGSLIATVPVQDAEFDPSRRQLLSDNFFERHRLR